MVLLPLWLIGSVCLIGWMVKDNPLVDFFDPGDFLKIIFLGCILGIFSFLFFVGPTFFILSHFYPIVEYQKEGEIIILQEIEHGKFVREIHEINLVNFEYKQEGNNGIQRTKGIVKFSVGSKDRRIENMIPEYKKWWIRLIAPKVIGISSQPYQKILVASESDILRRTFPP